MCGERVYGSPASRVEDVELRCLDCDWKASAVDLWAEFIAEIVSALEPLAWLYEHTVGDDGALVGGTHRGDLRRAAELVAKLREG